MLFLHLRLVLDFQMKPFVDPKPRLFLLPRKERKDSKAFLLV
jgi:hypothetical protein